MVAEPYNDDLLQEEETQAPEKESTAPWTFMLVIALVAQVVAMVLAWKELGELFRGV